ncbi:MAG: acyl-CoA dehydrogenase family protein [Parvibaculum sp.]|uniref:acyl-CoA dehydrogenase family protein n=1 Tax=Parvibaculum sp. TaxID=2024848 RepID=UPI003C73BF7D
MNELQTILSDSVNRLMTDHATKQTIMGAEDGVWPQALWDELVANGLTRVLVPEALEGAGATWSDAYVVLKAAGEHAAPLPLAEAILAGWILGRAGIAVPDGVVTVMEGDFLLAEGRLSGKATRVAWGRNASYAVALVKSGWGVEAVLAPLEYARIERDQNVAREPRDTLIFERVVVETGWVELPENALRLYGALARACQMAGALNYLTAQSVQYANERTQFGKPIGKFQAIQQQLAELSTQSAAAGIAATHACACADKSEAAFEIAVAKVRADDASSIATSIAHQVHGAIGFTYEHGLHFATRRLWSWRAEFGSGAEWAERLGREAMARGADELWPYVTAR